MFMVYFGCVSVLRRNLSNVFRPMHILYSVQTRTHPGKVRENNEDAFGAVLDWRKKLGLSDEILQQRGHLFAVADGMGGHAAGEVASNQAISTLFTEYYTGEWVDPQTTLAAAIEAANRTIFEMAEANDAMSGMGTTLVAALYQPQQWLIANVGDSRAYLYRSDKINQVTQDHSWVAEQVSSGILTEDEAAHHPLRNVITRSLGSEAKVHVDFFLLNARPGDILLLCSDGLSNIVSEKEMHGILQAYELDEAAERLLELALERGAPDNVTFALVQSVGDGQRRSRSLLPWLAIIAAVFILGGFVYWNFTRDATPHDRPRAMSIGTFTPIITPEPETSGASSTAAPTTQPAMEGMAASPLPTPEATAAEAAAQIGKDSSVVVATPDAADGRTLILVSGQGKVEPIPEDESWETIVVVTDAGGIFSATLDESRYVGRQATIVGGQVALVGYALEMTGAEQSLDPLLLLSPFTDGETFAVIWQADDEALQTFADGFGWDVERILASDSWIIQLNR